MNTVIYHSADFDGLACREIARKFLPNDTVFVGWDYQDALLVFPPEGTVYVLDLNPECFVCVPDEEAKRLVWIDHHRTAMDKFSSGLYEWDGVRVDGVAACRLCWQWFSELQMHDPEGEGHTLLPGSRFPTRQQFAERQVNEPEAIRLIGEHDVWDHRDPQAQTFNYGLKSQIIILWDVLLPVSVGMSDTSMAFYGSAHGEITRILLDGGVFQRGKEVEYAEIIKAGGFTLQWEGYTFLACNNAVAGSALFTAGIRSEHSALLRFHWNATNWAVSMYHVPGFEHLDLSALAAKYGGGGHRGACGFGCKKLPFSLPALP